MCKNQTLNKTNIQFKKTYGMRSSDARFSLNCSMTLLKVNKLLLIFPASLSLSPVAPVCSALSEPAKSTKFNALTKAASLPSAVD